MRSLRRILLIAFGIGAAACGGTDGAPLGGPYGGTGSSPPPTAGQSTDDTDPTPDGDDPGASNQNQAGTSSSSSGGSHSTSSSSSSSGGTSSTSSSSSGGSQSSSSGSGPTSPTWTSIYNAYLASGTIGRCPDCHGQTRTAAGAYTWLKGKQQIPDIADPNASCLSWLGGNMPPRGPASNSKATSDLAAWAAAGGAQN